MICLGNILQLLISNHIKGLTDSFVLASETGPFLWHTKGFSPLLSSPHLTSPLPLALSMLLRLETCQFYPTSSPDPYAPLVILIPTYFRYCTEQLVFYLNSLLDYSITSQGKQCVKCCGYSFSVTAQKVIVRGCLFSCFVFRARLKTTRESWSFAPDVSNACSRPSGAL